VSGDSFPVSVLFRDELLYLFKFFSLDQAGKASCPSLHRRREAGPQVDLLRLDADEKDATGVWPHVVDQEP
jgi:hypothetical protein